MPKRLKIYLDTSIPNAYFDGRNSFRKEITKEFWKKLNDYEIFVSDLVIKEIEDTRDELRKSNLLSLIGEFNVLSSSEEEIRSLAEEYVIRGIIPIKKIEDAIHIAIASFYYLDALVSWNFEHIVKLKTKREINVINVLLGYNTLEIIEPSVL
jgi:predicted nucleic acid-binding protein